MKIVEIVHPLALIGGFVACRCGSRRHAGVLEQSSVVQNMTGLSSKTR